MSPCATPRKTKVKRRWMYPCATPGTQNEGGCHQVPRLPRKVPRRHRRPAATKRATQCHKCHACHACHAKCRGVTGDQRRPSAPRSAISATPATQNEGGCHQVPRLPRKVPRRHRRLAATKRATQCHLPRITKVDGRLCHACHVKPSATPATQSAAASPATNGDQARHAVP